MAELGIDIARAAEWLKKGFPVGIPTETVYGLAANALDESAVVKVFEAKERPAFDPLIVHVSSINRIEDYAHSIPEEAYVLARSFMPGPLTLILPKKEIIPDLVTSGHSTVGIRIPAHPLIQSLLQSIDFPLAAPSANKFGFVSPTEAQHVQEQLGNEIPYILDGGPCEVGLESTIISFDQNEPVILRLGGLALEDIESVLNRKVNRVLTSSSKPQAPGMLTAHYSPGVPVYFGSWASRPDDIPLSKTALLCLQKPEKLPNDVVVFELSKSGDLAEAATALFRGLRSFKGSKVELIVAEPMPESGLGRAINDRLRRAAASKQ